jgi:hypothetical protein
MALEGKEAIDKSSSITIIDEGAVSDEDFKEMEKEFAEMTKKFDQGDGCQTNIYQYGPMWIVNEAPRRKRTGN